MLPVFEFNCSFAPSSIISATTTNPWDLNILLKSSDNSGCSIINATTVSAAWSSSKVCITCNSESPTKCFILLKTFSIFIFSASLSKNPFSLM